MEKNKKKIKVVKHDGEVDLFTGLKATPMRVTGLHTEEVEGGRSLCVVMENESYVMGGKIPMYAVTAALAALGLKVVRANKECCDPMVLSGNKHCNICSGEGCEHYKHKDI